MCTHLTPVAILAFKLGHLAKLPNVFDILAKWSNANDQSTTSFVKCAHTGPRVCTHLTPVAILAFKLGHLAKLPNVFDILAK